MAITRRTTKNCLFFLSVEIINRVWKIFLDEVQRYSGRLQPVAMGNVCVCVCASKPIHSFFSIYHLNL